jgi:hypothetical protein
MNMAGFLSVFELFAGMVLLFWFGKLIGDALNLDKYLEGTPVNKPQELK